MRIIDHRTATTREREREKSEGFCATWSHQQPKRPANQARSVSMLQKRSIARWPRRRAGSRLVVAVGLARREGGTAQQAASIGSWTDDGRRLCRSAACSCHHHCDHDAAYPRVCICSGCLSLCSVARDRVRMAGRQSKQASKSPLAFFLFFFFLEEK